ncbi:hypothetical protein L0F63_006166 [Massospora cicadina]|nr:hypothetical protein L0F63_006166 [Massospora cicadina]
MFCHIIQAPFLTVRSQKFRSSDNDFRFMAATDLTELLSLSNFVLEEYLAIKVVNGVLDLLQDKNSHSETRNVAVKCLGPLSCKVTSVAFSTMLETLRELLENSDLELRELAALGLKTIITSVPAQEPVKQDLLKTYVPKLIELLPNASYESQYDLLEVLIEIFTRFGQLIFVTAEAKSDVDLQTKCADAFSPLLKHPRSSLRKRSSLALGALAGHLGETEFDQLTSSLMEELKSTTSEDSASISSVELAKSLINCFAVLSRAATSLILQQFSRNDDELRDACLQAFESFALLCPSEMIPYVPDVTRLSLEYLSYDPNYAEVSVDECDQENWGGDDPDDEFEDDFDGDFSNDDDVSWKVRRACAKTLGSLVNVYPEKLPFFYEAASLKLISRFSEREEVVRVEVLLAFTALLHQTFSQDHHLVKELTMNDIEYEAIRDVEGISNKRRKVQTPQSSPQPAPNAMQQGILDQLPRIITKTSAQLSSKSALTKQACFVLLTDLTRTLPGALGSYVPNLAPGVQSVLEAEVSKGALIGASTPKLEALTFLRELLRSHQPGTFHDQLSWLCPAVLEYLVSSSPKLSEEAFLVCRELIKSMQPVLLSDPSLYEEVPEATDYLRIIHAKLVECLSNDTDQAIRERGIRTLGVLLFHTASPDGDNVLFACSVRSLWLDIHSFLTTIFNSPALTWDGAGAGVPLIPQAEELFQMLTSNLRKGSRLLRMASLECMVTIQRCLQRCSVGHPLPLSPLFGQLEAMLLEFDLQELSLALTLLVNTLAPTLSPDSRREVLSFIDQPALFAKLARLPLSSHLQGVANEQFNQLLVAILGTADELASGTNSELANRFVDAFLSHVLAGKLEYSSAKLVFFNLAQSLSAVIQASSGSQFVPIFARAAQNPQSAVSERYLAFLVLGRLSLKGDVAAYVDLFQCSLACFEDSHAELRLVAASAMGNFVASNLTALFPRLIHKIREHDHHRYLFLHAFKEVITQYVAQDLQADSMEQFVDEFWDLLIFDQAAQKGEESTRNVVAECLGILTMAYPARFLPKLHSQIRSQSKDVRCVVITAIRSTFHMLQGQAKLTSLLKPYMTGFLSLLKDSELEVRRLALMTLNAAAHQRPGLIQPVLPSILPLLFAETEVKPDLIHVVVMGPFKHKVDDGLENRKAAYECFYTLLDTCHAQLDVGAICNTLVLAGLRDSHDIKLLAHMLIVRLAKTAPAYVRHNLEHLAQPMAEDLAVELKGGALRQEAEKHMELIRSTLRAVAALESISQGYPHPQFDRLCQSVLSGNHKDEYKTVLASYKAL